MNVVAQIAAGLAVLFHLLAFGMESLWFSRPQVHRRFGLSAEEARVVRPMAFNQGFYNLFLALGVAGGLAAVNTGHVTVGRTLVLYACGCMALAGVVLIVTDRRFVAAASGQILPPLVVFAATVL